MPESWLGTHGESDEEATVRVLLRAVLGWVAHAFPGHVARLEVYQRHAVLPLLCEAIVLLTNKRRYRFTLATVSGHMAVCLGEPRLIDDARNAPSAKESPFLPRWPGCDTRSSTENHR